MFCVLCVILLFTSTSFAGEKSSVSTAKASTADDSGHSDGAPNVNRIQQINDCAASVNGKVINLEPLQQTDGGARFTAAYGGWNYSFNPCIPFNKPLDPHIGNGDHCHFVSVCIYAEQNKKLFHYTAGIQKSAHFIVKDDNSSVIQLVFNGLLLYAGELFFIFVIMFSNWIMILEWHAWTHTNTHVFVRDNKRSIRNKKTIITLICDESRVSPDEGEFTVSNNIGKGHIYAELRHLCCCPGACDNSSAVTLAESKDVEISESYPDGVFLLIVVGVVIGLLLLTAVIAAMCYSKQAPLRNYFKLPGLHSQSATPRLSNSLEKSLNRHNQPATTFLDYESHSKKKHTVPVLEDYCIPHSELSMKQRLGGGTFGDTYVAWWNDNTVTLKRITMGGHEQLMTDELVSWMKNEISFISRQRHRNIIAVIGMCLDDVSLPYIISEYFEGTSVKDFISRDGSSISWPTRVKISWDGYSTIEIYESCEPFHGFDVLVKQTPCQQTVDGMVHLHSIKPPLLHRDLRCANILINDSSQVKVCDFGITKFIQPLRDGCQIDNCFCQREVSTCPATIRWSAPELLYFADSPEMIPQFISSCDVYSFGITMWEILVREEPFKNISSQTEVMEIVRNGGRPLIPNFIDVMPTYRDLMRSCWVPEPEARPTFKQISVKLKEIVQLSRSFEKTVIQKEKLLKRQENINT